VDGTAGKICTTKYVDRAPGTLRIAVEKTFPREEIKQAVGLANAYRRGGMVLVTPNGLAM
jgi:hypothetical protein